MSYEVVTSFQHSYGKVALTQIQLDWVIERVKGLDKTTRSRGSTHSAVVDKIKNATGWDEMKPLPMLCRFAYVNGIVKL